MAFESELMARATTSFSDGKTAIQWTYGPSATDDIATIVASGYFDEWKDQINKSDYLYLAGTDGEDIRAFTSVLGVVPVTVASFITAGDIADGSITTPKLAALAVTNAKLAPDAVEEVNILDGAVTTGKVADGSLIQAKLATNSMDATIVSSLVVGAQFGTIPVEFRVITAGGASANIDIPMDHKVTISDVSIVVVGLGTASDTITIQNVTTDITNAMDVSVANTVVVRVGTLNVATWTINAGNNLRIVQTDGAGNDSPVCEVIIRGTRSL